MIKKNLILLMGLGWACNLSNVHHSGSGSARDRSRGDLVVMTPSTINKFAEEKAARGKRH